MGKHRHHGTPLYKVRARERRGRGILRDMRRLSVTYRIRKSWGELALNALACCLGTAAGLGLVVYLARMIGL